MASTEKETIPRDPTTVLRDIKDAEWDRDVEDKKRLLLSYIHHHGILAPMTPEHHHRIQMMRLDLELAETDRRIVFGEADMLDEAEVHEKRLKNYRSWARFMKTVGTNDDPHFNKMLIEFINQEIENTEFTLSVVKGALDGMIAQGYEPLRFRIT